MFIGARPLSGVATIKKAAGPDGSVYVAGLNETQERITAEPPPAYPYRYSSVPVLVRFGADGGRDAAFGGGADCANMQVDMDHAGGVRPKKIHASVSSGRRVGSMYPVRPAHGSGVVTLRSFT